jgi:hypothetical protein
MYYNYKFMDSLLKTNIRGYLIDMMENKGYFIIYNNYIKGDRLDKKEMSKDKKNLSEFETELLSNDKSIEKHFNLRIFLNSNIDTKLTRSIDENLFIETLKNKYSKIKICKELMNVLGIHSLNDFNKEVSQKFNTDIKNNWLDENIETIKKTFDIRTKNIYGLNCIY